MRAFLVLLFLCARAAAVEYEAPIDVANESDLDELAATDQITPSTLTTLMELLHDGVDLDTADAQRIYALPGVTTAQADAIVALRQRTGHVDENALAAIVGEQRLATLRPFLTRDARWGAWARGESAWTTTDDRPPPGALQARLRTPFGLQAGGALVVTENRLGAVAWDPARGVLVAEPAAPRGQLPKAYLEWNTPDVDVIAGSYRAGFGQRLVFDDTDQVTPNGFSADDTLFHATALARESAGHYVTADLRWRDGLFGLAVQARHLRLGDGWLQLVGFASDQAHSIYQYELFERTRCADPHADADPGCVAPAVMAAASPSNPMTPMTFATLPGVWSEPLAGGNLTYFADRRTHLGVTGYGARPRWLVEGVALDFQEWSRFPSGGGYGAVGLDGALGVGPVDLTFEVGRSFDSMIHGGGGWGAITRDTISWGRQELELVFRYYAPTFANPYAGSISEPDELDGQRARDEVGPRLRYAGAVGPVLLRAMIDLWVQPSLGIPKLYATFRGDTRLGGGWSAGLWLSLEDKDLGVSGRGQCFSEPQPGEVCRGVELKTTALLRVEPHRRLALAGEVGHVFVDDPAYPDRFRQDLTAYLTATWWPVDALRVYARGKLLDQALDGAVNLERSLWSYVEVSWRRARAWDLTLRYDLVVYLDDRVSTTLRTPNPEHRLRLAMEGRF